MKVHDPEALGLVFHRQDPAFINVYCRAATT